MNRSIRCHQRCCATNTSVPVIRTMFSKFRLSCAAKNIISSSVHTASARVKLSAVGLINHRDDVVDHDCYGLRRLHGQHEHIRGASQDRDDEQS